MKKISIAMATYNGARYIADQIESIAKQTRPPDELIVSDDCSSDETIETLKSIARQCFFPVRISVNEKRLGYALNFASAISLCSGDLIMLSDQDDYWLPQKIERVISFFEENPCTMVLVNDAELADESLHPVGATKIDRLRAAGLNLDDFSTGCCTSFRSEILPLILPIPAEYTAHDTWIHSIGRWLGRRSVLCEVLQYLRRHGSNASDSMTSSLDGNSFSMIHVRRKRYDRARMYANMLQAMEIARERFSCRCSVRLSAAEKEGLLSSALEAINHEERLFRRRLEIIESRMPRRACSAFSFLLSGGYKNFNGWRSFVNDCLR